MSAVNIVREIDSLPPEAQKEVMDFVAFLKTRYLPLSPIKKIKHAKLVDEPFVGMWRDREEMQDSATWVRGLRQQEWERSA
jgi:hypothetical protein